MQKNPEIEIENPLNDLNELTLSNSASKDVDYNSTTEHLYTQVARHLKKRILNRDFGEDGRIPNYVQLTEEYNVSMSTVKKAMQILNDENIISSRVGKGTFANPDLLVTQTNSAMVGSGKIGLLIRDIQGPYFSGVYDGLAEGADSIGKRLLLTVSRDIHQQEDSMLQMMIEHPIEGLLITTRRKTLFGINTFDRLVERKIPTVLLHDVYESRIPIVDVDNKRGGAMAANVLARRKCNKMCVVVGENGFKVDDFRLQGFLDEAEKNGYVKSDILILRISVDSESSAFEEGLKIGRILDLKRLGIDGIFLFNDLMAMGFQKAMFERSISIPNDIAVVGYDDIDRCDEALVPLTTIRAPRKKIGLSAIEMLHMMIKRGQLTDKTPLYLEPSVIERDSA